MVDAAHEVEWFDAFWAIEEIHGRTRMLGIVVGGAQSGRGGSEARLINALFDARRSGCKRHLPDHRRLI
jgi:hypothetical protein